MPRNTSLNWFIPALVKSRVGSLVGTSELERTTRWPRSSKNRRKVLRISLPVCPLFTKTSVGDGSLLQMGCAPATDEGPWFGLVRVSATAFLLRLENEIIYLTQNPPPAMLSSCFSCHAERRA